MLVFDLDERGAVSKRMVIDPDREPLYRLIFRLALRGKRSGTIARAVNDAGWLTKPFFKRGAPRVFTPDRVLAIIKNPRYAGLSIFDGEVLARGHWPAYITERQHNRLRAAFGERRPTKEPRQLETYLLRHLAICGHCGAPLYTRTGLPHRDGTFARRYACRDHARDRHSKRCTAMPIDAGILEAMFVSSLRSLLIGDRDNPDATRGDAAHTEAQGIVAGRERLRDAVLAGDERQLDSALDALFARMQPEAALIRDTAISQRRARELDQAQRFQTWILQDASMRTEASRVEAHDLNLLLRTWFSTVLVRFDAATVRIVAQRHPSAGWPPFRSAEVSIDRSQWTRFAPLDRARQRHDRWEDAEIIGAIQAWADTHGHRPTWADWSNDAAGYPNTRTVLAHFGSWRRAYRQASLKPENASPARKPKWDDIDVIHALTDWTSAHGQPPGWADWLKGTPNHPCATTVRTHFGTFQAALAAAGLQPGDTSHATA